MFLFLNHSIFFSEKSFYFAIFFAVMLNNIYLISLVHNGYYLYIYIRRTVGSKQITDLLIEITVKYG